LALFLLPSVMFISARLAALEPRWRHRTVLIAVLIAILSRLRGSKRAVCTYVRVICRNMNLASTPIVPVLVLNLAPGSLIEVLRWSLAAGEPPHLDHVLSNARGAPHA
jgi:hypothetical protein